MLKEQLRNILALFALLAIGLVINTTFFPKKPVCPSDLASDEERIDSVTKWTEEFVQDNPEATLEEMLEARVNFLTKNNCKETLEYIRSTELEEQVEDSQNVTKEYTDEERELDEASRLEVSCLEQYILQKEYFDDETLSQEFTFDKYESSYSEPNILKELDLDSSKTARYFRTTTNNQLKNGINFDGKYTMVGIGFTGGDDADWIVDRTTGKAYEFPYEAFTVQFTNNSNLIILNSRADIERMSVEEGHYDCNSWGVDGTGIMAYDLVPHYFLWENNQLKHLGPKEFEPLTNFFWESYFEHRI